MGWVRREELDRAKVDAYSAYDRLDAVLSENERLMKLLDDERNRNQDMAACVIDTLREALGMDKPRDVQSGGIPSCLPGCRICATGVGVDTASHTDTPEMPKAIKEAIEATFPDDAVIQQANLKYAYSQESRWEDHAEEIATEIRQGA